MGANGSFASGATASESGRRWKTVAVLSNGFKVIELKDKNAQHKAPEESHSPNSVYVMFNKNGKGIKSISFFGSDGKKDYEIHTTPHKKLGAHYHKWTNGKPGEAIPLTSSMKKILDEVKSLL